MKKLANYRILLAVCDFLIVRAAISAALQMPGVSTIHGETWYLYLVSGEFYFFFIYAIIALIIFHYHHLYRINIALSRVNQTIAIGAAMFYVVLGLTVVAFFLRSPYIMHSRLALVSFGTICFLAMTAYRLFLFRPIYRMLIKSRVIEKNVLLVGASSAAINFAIQLQVNDTFGLRLVGFVDDQLARGERVLEHYRNLGTTDEIPSIVQQNNVHEVIVAVSDVSRDELLRLLDLCKSTPAAVKVNSTLFDIIHKKTVSHSYFDIPLAGLSNHLPHSGGLFFRRAFDVVLSLLGLLILGPLLVAVALLVKLTSPGPVLFKQIRIGKDGKPFEFYKFRSMHLGSEEDSDREKKMKAFVAGERVPGNGSLKLVNESRVTSIGRFIRKTSIDEMPQLLNVLKGDMGLVGPRPCLPYEYEVYKEWHKRRLSVTPGCTGLWQVTCRSECEFDDMVMLDLYYIDNMSPWLDLQLILKTVPVMVFGKGAK